MFWQGGTKFQRSLLGLEEQVTWEVLGRDIVTGGMELPQNGQL